jgi:hypothetical protein
MTTLVTITNESEKNIGDHIVLVKQNGQVIQKLYPGQRTTTIHVWEHGPITLEEQPLES